MFIAGLLWV